MSLIFLPLPVKTARLFPRRRCHIHAMTNAPKERKQYNNRHLMFAIVRYGGLRPIPSPGLLVPVVWTWARRPPASTIHHQHIFNVTSIFA